MISVAASIANGFQTNPFTTNPPASFTLPMPSGAGTSAIKLPKVEVPLPGIEATKQVLRERMRPPPEEQGMRAGFEPLYTV